MDPLLKQFLDAGAATVAGNVILNRVKVADWTRDGVFPTADGSKWLAEQNVEPQQVAPPPLPRRRREVKVEAPSINSEVLNNLEEE